MKVGDKTPHSAPFVRISAPRYSQIHQRRCPPASFHARRSLLLSTVAHRRRHRHSSHRSYFGGKRNDFLSSVMLPDGSRNDMKNCIDVAFRPSESSARCRSSFFRRHRRRCRSLALVSRARTQFPPIYFRILEKLRKTRARAARATDVGGRGIKRKKERRRGERARCSPRREQARGKT